MTIQLGGEGCFVGIPLYISNGTLIGTLCILDQFRYSFYPEQIKKVEAFANFLVHTLMHESLIIRDRLTGQYNRNFVEMYFNQHISVENQPLAILNFDLDRFKLINDTFGYKLGDSLIKVISERIKDRLNEREICCRIGDDEFLVLLPILQWETYHNFVMEISEDIINAISSTIIVGNQEIHINSSLGISIYPLHGNDIQTLLRKSDIALNLAKKNETGLEFYDTEHGNKLLRRLNIENTLLKAVERNEFEMYYQSQFDMDTGKLIGLEALIRWKHPNKDFISPAEFIPIAEESGLIIEIGNWVIAEVCRQAKDWIDQGLEPIQFSLNISSLQLRADGFIDRVKSLLETTNLPPQLLNFEITETILMENIKNATVIFEQLKDIGIRIAIDDFGTGYSSLSYLKSIPADYLKIDKGFIDEIIEHKGDQAIVNTIISLGKELDMSIVAEGIEKLEQHLFLKEMGSLIGQGYFYHRPSPIETIIEDQLKIQKSLRIKGSLI